MDHSTAMATTLVLGKLLVWLAHNPAAVVALLALLSGLPTFVLTRNAALYANFDTLYQNVLQMGLQNGAFRNPGKTGDYFNFPPDVRAAYETYAYMVFNVCETIADGLSFYEHRRRQFMETLETIVRFFLPITADRGWLRKTWLPVLVAEKQLHGTWLQDQKGGVCFKQEFLDLMANIHP